MSEERRKGMSTLRLQGGKLVKVLADGSTLPVNEDRCAALQSRLDRIAEITERWRVNGDFDEDSDALAIHRLARGGE